MKYRKLSNKEISQLIVQGCSCEDWDLIEVAEEFYPDRLEKVHFSGFVRLGRFDKEIILFRSVYVKSGIYNSHLCNCFIESNALIKNLKVNLSNCHIGEYVVLLNNEQDSEDKKKYTNESKIWLVTAREAVK